MPGMSIAEWEEFFLTRFGTNFPLANASCLAECPSAVVKTAPVWIKHPPCGNLWAPTMKFAMGPATGPSFAKISPEADIHTRLGPSTAKSMTR